jgi:hypothetical protein
MLHPSAIPPPFEPASPTEPRAHYGQRIALYIARHACCSPFEDSDLELASSQCHALFDKASPEVVQLLNDVKSAIRLSLTVRKLDRLKAEPKPAIAARPSAPPPADRPQGGSRVPANPRPIAPPPPPQAMTPEILRSPSRIAAALTVPDFDF